MPEVLVVGRIHTLDPARPRAGGALARDGRFVMVGDARDCARAAGPRARRIDLGHGAAIPGLVDAHGHVVLHGRALVEVDCRGAASPEACAARAAERARSMPPGRWIRGRGWDENDWPGAGLPGIATLTAAVPDHPVLLERVDGHAAWVNARALVAAGIGPTTPDPAGGKIVRDARGAPAGVLVDRAQDLVLARIPPPSEAEVEEAILRSLSALARVGLTGVHDAGMPASATAVFRRLAAEGRLPLRVYGMLDGTVEIGALRERMAAWREEPEVGWLTVRAVKLFADGALGSRGAALLEPYADDPGNRGLLLLEAPELRARLAAIVGAGYQPAIHAIGDRACREVLHALVEAGAAARALRPRVEHLQILQPGDAALLTAAGAVASMQPVHATGDAPWVVRRLGEGTARLRGAYAWRAAVAAGAPLAFGSDFPVEDPDPRAGLHAAEVRRGRDGRPFSPEERLTRVEAIRAFTQGAAWASFAEERRGMVREGLDADLTAFAEDPLAVDAEALPRLPVTLTLIGGRVEHASA